MANEHSAGTPPVNFYGQQQQYSQTFNYNYHAQPNMAAAVRSPAAAPTIMNSAASTSTPVPSRALRQSTRKRLGTTPRDSPGLVHQPLPPQSQLQLTPSHLPTQVPAASPAPATQAGYAPYYAIGSVNPAVAAASYAATQAFYNPTGAPVPTGAPAAPGLAPVGVPPVPTTTQALHTSYPSRIRTGVTLLMQPILAPAAAAAETGRRKPRVNYADGMSADEFEADSDDSDGGARAKRAAASKAAAQVLLNNMAAAKLSNELDQSYLGKLPPSRFVTLKPAVKTKHVYATEDVVKAEAEKPELLIPIRIEVDTDTHRIRDCFVWNLNERLITPDAFAQAFCQDLDLPLAHVENIVNMMRAQMEEHSGIAAVDLTGEKDEQEPDCRVVLRLDVQIDNHHLIDHIEWDLSSSTPPEVFAQQLCNELGLGGEAVPLVSHAIREEILLHKKDAVEWGVVGGGPLEYSFGRGSQRGPRRLKGVWRDWMEVKDYGPRIDELTTEDLEKREMERERASRRMRRETSKFQRSTVSSYYRDRNRSSRNR